MGVRYSIAALIVTLATATAAPASVKIITPLPGSQVVGPTLVEAATDAPAVNRVELYVDGSLAGVAKAAPYRFAYDFGEDLSKRHVVEVVAWSSNYKTKESARIETAAFGAAESMNVDFVEVPVRLRSTRRAISPGDFSISENGKAQRIAEVRATRQPAHFVFVVDRSLSMGGGKLDAAITAVRRALTQLRPGDDAKLLLFNHRVDPPRAIASGFSSEVAPTGGTSVRDAVASLKSLRKGIVIVMTDGGDRNSETSPEEALRDVSAGNVTLYSISLGGGEGTDFLRAAAQKSGGMSLVSSREHLSNDIDRVMSEINSRYTLSYQSTNTGRGWRNIEVRAKRGVEVLASRKGYYAE